MDLVSLCPLPAWGFPNLQPPGRFVSKQMDVFDPVCFAPMAPGWPWRKDRLGRLAGTFPYANWAEAPLPEGFDPLFFQAAPPDHQVPEIRPNEKIILENLHPDHVRLATSLPGLRPRAIADRATGEREEVALVADTLFIDTDRSVCVVVWRGRIGLRHAQEAGRSSVTLAEDTDIVQIPSSAAPVAPVAQAAPQVPPPPPARGPLQTLAVEDIDIDDDQDNGLITLVPPNEMARPGPLAFVPGTTGTQARVMPFMASEQPVKGSDASIPVYMPKSLDQTLPTLVSMNARLIVECHLQQDPYDSSPYVLRTVAVGRSYQFEALRGMPKHRAFERVDCAAA